MGYIIFGKMSRLSLEFGDDISAYFYWYLYYDADCHETLHSPSLISPITTRYMKIKYFI